MTNPGRGHRDWINLHAQYCLMWCSCVSPCASACLAHSHCNLNIQAGDQGLLSAEDEIQRLRLALSQVNAWLRKCLHGSLCRMTHIAGINTL